MENATPSVGSAELPTGFFVDQKVENSLTFRELAGPEEDLLAAKMPITAKMSAIMANCTQSIGNIKEPAKIRALMDQMVMTDRWFYILKLRIFSLGSAYPFESVCPNCDHKDKVTFDLNDIVVINPPKPENLFREITTERGTKIRWKIATAETEAKIEKLATEDKKVTIALFCRITEINDKPATLTDVVSMSLKDRNEFKKSVEKEEGDFDDKYKATCPKCTHEYEGELNLDLQTFFYQ